MTMTDAASRWPSAPSVGACSLAKMADFLGFLGVSTAVTLVVIQGTLFDRLRGPEMPRLLRELLSCALCLGVWVGMGVWVLSSRDPSLLDHLPSWAGFGGETLGFGALTGVSALTVHRIWDALDAVGGW